MRFLSLAICSLSLLGLFSSSVRAQYIGGGEAERGLRPGAHVPFEGVPYTQRYSFDTAASFLFLNGNAHTLWYLDYLDRADRADKFGYCPPPDPFLYPSPPVAHPVRVGIGLGFFRHR
jgi:hypothetical protein